MKNTLILAAIAVAGLYVYRRSAAPAPPPPGGLAGTATTLGGYFDSIVGSIRGITSDVRGIAGTLGPKPIDGSVNDSAGSGYSTRTDARGTTYARRHVAAVWPNDSTYAQTVMGLG